MILLSGECIQNIIVIFNHGNKNLMHKCNNSATWLKAQVLLYTQASKSLTWNHIHIIRVSETLSLPQFWTELNESWPWDPTNRKNTEVGLPW